MKKITFVLAVLSGSFLFSNSVFAQDEAIKLGEKAAITFFDFDFAAGYFGYKSPIVDPEGPKTLENRTLFQVLRQMESKINEKYGVELEPAKYDSTDETRWVTAKCFPKIKTKQALALGYDKIIEIRAYMRPSSTALSYGPVSAPKPVMWLNLKILDKAGKTVFNTSAQEKDDERQVTVNVAPGFSATGGFSGKSILELYATVLDKVFAKAEKKK